VHTHAIGIYDDSLHETELLEEQLIEDFPRAIREKQFQVYYQPKFDVRPETPIEGGNPHGKERMQAEHEHGRRNRPG
jgi:hypothetical protein